MFNALMKKKVNRQIFLKIWCKLDTKCPEKSSIKREIDDNFQPIFLGANYIITLLLNVQ